jgi:hypothetical protein
MSLARSRCGHFGGVLFVAASTSIDQLGSDIDGEAAAD